MYAGRKVEEAPVGRAVRRTRSTRTRSGCSARSRGRRGDERPAARDPRPRAARSRELPAGCAFADRCPRADDPTCAEVPELRERRPGPPRRVLPSGARMTPTARRPCSRSTTSSSTSASARGIARRRHGRARGRRRLVRDRPGRDARPRRRVGQRQVDGRQLRPAAARADRGHDPPARRPTSRTCRAARCGRCGARCTSSSRTRTRRSTRG